MYRKIIGFSAALLLLASALTPAAHAQSAPTSSLTVAQISAIISLLHSFGAEQSIINNVSASLSGSTATSAAPSCLDLTYNLSAGTTDSQSAGQVSQLQVFLGVTQTGYYGPMTQQAVQNWQASHSIVSSGSPDTTGYGFVGPQTRAAMGCGGPTPPAQSNQPTNTGNASPVASQTSIGPTGAISSQGCVIPVGQSTCPLNVTWRSSNTNSGLVDIDIIVPNQTNESDFLSAQSGSGSFAWSTPNQANFGPGNYIFKLYNHNPANTSSSPTVVPAYPTPLATSQAATIIACAAGSMWNRVSKTCDASTAQVCAAGTVGIYPNCATVQMQTLLQCTNAISQRGQSGQSFSCSCPAGYTTTAHTIWGAGTYTDDSDMCTAAIQAGVVTAAAGGMVSYTVEPGLSSYQAAYQNGVGSNAYGAWQGSYTFPGVTVTPPSTATPAPAVTVTANPTAISYGQSATLSWSSTNASSCTSSQFATGGATSGNMQIPSKVSSVPGALTTPYYVTCVGSGGSTSSFANIVDNGQGTGVVNSPPAAASTPFIASFTVGIPAGAQWPILANSPFSLTWTTSGMASCALAIPSGTTSAGAIAGSQLVGSQTFTAATAGTYAFALNCTGQDGKAYTASAAAVITAPVAQSCPAHTTGTYPNCQTVTSLLLTTTAGVTVPGSSQPVTGAAPLAVNFSLSYPHGADRTGYYVIDYGDGYTFGGSGQTQDAADCSPSDTFGTCTGAAEHTYNPTPVGLMPSATYTPVLHGPVTNSNCPGCTIAQAIQRAPVVATGPAVTVTGISQNLLNVIPQSQSGSSPLTVTFGSLLPAGSQFGPFTFQARDGSADIPVPTCTLGSSGSCSTPTQFTHTYTWSAQHSNNSLWDYYFPQFYSSGLGMGVGRIQVSIKCTPSATLTCPTS